MIRWAFPPLDLGGLLVSCAPEASESPPFEPAATCAETAPRWEDFGEPFMQSYCVRCHDGSLSGSARRGAPSDHNFNTVLEVRRELAHIYVQAGAGDTFANTAMPPDGLAPSLEERKRLTEWLVCGAP